LAAPMRGQMLTDETRVPIEAARVLIGGHVDPVSPDYMRAEVMKRLTAQMTLNLAANLDKKTFRAKDHALDGDGERGVRHKT
jgi:hypothetical protein